MAARGDFPGAFQKYLDAQNEASTSYDAWVVVEMVCVCVFSISGSSSDFSPARSCSCYCTCVSFVWHFVALALLHPYSFAGFFVCLFSSSSVLLGSGFIPRTWGPIRYVLMFLHQSAQLDTSHFLDLTGRVFLFV
jgi:hypothetical protein